MPLREVPEKFYKYLKAERLVKILKEPSLRFTGVDDLNDPFESHLTLDVEAVKNDYLNFRRQQTPGISDNELQEIVNASEASLVENALLRYRKLRNEFTVFSLTTDPLQLLMWAHYGDEHRGVVVELDIWHPSIRMGSPGGEYYSSLEKVEYDNMKVAGLPSPETMVSVITRKSQDWSYEKEWRLIRTKNMTREKSENINVVDIDLSVVKSIYLGARIPIDNVKKIVELLKANGREDIRLWKVDIAPNKFELKITDIKDYGWKLMHREHHFGEAWQEALMCLPMEDDK